LAQEKIGWALRVDFGASTPSKDNFTSVRTGLSMVSRSGHLLRISPYRNMRESAAAELRHFGREKKLGGCDGDSVKARAAQFESQRGEDLLFVAEVASVSRTCGAGTGSFWVRISG